jgi:hypothetical protein
MKKYEELFRLVHPVWQKPSKIICEFGFTFLYVENG